MDLKQLQHSPSAFRSALLIDADGLPKRLGDVLDPWQAKDFQALDSGWRKVAGLGGDGGVQRAYLERGRGASKTTDLAVQSAWCLFASRRRLVGVAAAADRDQAQLLRNAIDGLCRMNPWLSSILEVSQYKVVNRRTGSELTILASDVASSWGLTPDFCVIDELTYWQKEELWVSLFSAIAKRKNALLCIIANAGFNQGESWQWRVREAARTSPDWYFHRLDRPPSWISEKHLEEQKRLLPDLAFRRLWLNEWSTGSGDALAVADIDKAVVLDGPQGPEKGWQYIAGLDLGLKRDASALVLLGKHIGWAEEIEKPKRQLSTVAAALIDLELMDLPPEDVEEVYHESTGRLKVCHVQVWYPKRGEKLDIEPIERSVVDLDRRFRLSALGYDPWQSEYLSERVKKQNIPVQPVQFVPQNLQSMAQSVLESFGERNIDLYDHPQLLSDLKNLRVTEKNYGIRLTSPRGPSGHGDAATALAISLHVAKTCRGLTPQPIVGKLIAE
jgi:phage terminase large subunit-like protein